MSLNPVKDVLTSPSRAFPRFGGHHLFAIISTGKVGCISLTRCEISKLKRTSGLVIVIPVDNANIHPCRLANIKPVVKTL